VVFDEGHHDEVVAVVVAVVAAQREVLPRRGAGRLEALGLKLPREKLVVEALVDEQLAREGAPPDELTRVVLLPRRAARPEVAREGLLAPGHLAGRHDGREGRHARVAARVAQREGERAVAAHGVPHHAPRDRRTGKCASTQAGSSSTT
jgi:hypothetical protein